MWVGSKKLHHCFIAAAGEGAISPHNMGVSQVRAGGASSSAAPRLSSPKLMNGDEGLLARRFIFTGSVIPLMMSSLSQ